MEMHFNWLLSFSGMNGQSDSSVTTALAGVALSGAEEEVKCCG